MTTSKTWEEFRSTGLLMFTNMFLQIFGWALVFEYSDSDELLRVYPARVTYRGFNSDTVSNAFIKLSEYMKENSSILNEEVKGD